MVGHQVLSVCDEWGGAATHGCWINGVFSGNQRYGRQLVQIFAIRKSDSSPGPVASDFEDIQLSAKQIITSLIESTDNRAETRAPYYADTVNYYGHLKSRDDVIADIQAFIKRWPTRDYTVNTITAGCGPTQCIVTGTMTFQADAPGRRSVGNASFDFTLRNDGGRLVISTEDGKATARQTSGK
jgi:hypothetical protein